MFVICANNPDLCGSCFERFCVEFCNWLIREFNTPSTKQEFELWKKGENYDTKRISKNKEG